MGSIFWPFFDPPDHKTVKTAPNRKNIITKLTRVLPSGPHIFPTCALFVTFWPPTPLPPSVFLGVGFWDLLAWEKWSKLSIFWDLWAWESVKNGHFSGIYWHGKSIFRIFWDLHGTSGLFFEKSMGFLGFHISLGFRAWKIEKFPMLEIAENRRFSGIYEHGKC